MTTWTDIASIVVSALGTAAVAGALVYYGQQTKALRTQVALQTEQAARSLTSSRAGLDLRLMELVMSLDRLFIEEPELRPYFYDGLPVPDDNPVRNRVLATGELIADLAETVLSGARHGQLDPEDERAWRVALHWYARSPAVRFVAERMREAYRPSTIELLLAEDPEYAHPLTGKAPADSSADGRGPNFGRAESSLLPDDEKTPTAESRQAERKDHG